MSFQHFGGREEYGIKRRKRAKGEVEIRHALCSIIGRLQTTEEHRRKEPLTTEFRCFANYPGSSNLVGRGTLYILPVYQPSLLLLLLLGFESPPLSRASLYRAPSRETIVSQESLSLSFSLSPFYPWPLGIIDQTTEPGVTAPFSSFNVLLLPARQGEV